MKDKSLKDKTVRGVAWSGIDTIAQYGVSFVVGIILARLLTPDDYGLLGIVAIFTAISSVIVNGGFNTALIRKPDLCDEDYYTVFFVNAISSVFLYGLIFLASPFIADFFGRKELVSITRISSLSIIIGALAIVPQTRLTVQIDFKSQTKISLISAFSSGVLGISMAYLGFGVWALIMQGLFSSSIRTFLFWVYNRWIPKLIFSRNSFNGLFGFGWKIMLSNILDSVWKQLYQVVVGKFYNPATLGQYTRSRQFAGLFSSNVTEVLQRVTYPVLSSIQDDKSRMADAYKRMIKLSMFMTSVIMFFIGAISEPLLYCLIGPKWHEAALYLPLICIGMSVYPLHSLNLNMLEVQGRSDLFLRLEIIKKIISLFPLFIGAFVGIMAMLYTNLLTTFLNFLLNSHYSGKIIGYTSWMQLKDILPSYVISIMVASSVYFFKYLPLSYWIVLPIQLIGGILVFILICNIRKPEEWYEIQVLLRPYYLNIRSKIFRS